MIQLNYQIKGGFFMKRIFISILILLVILGLTGCALKIYKLPKDKEGFCYTTYEREEIELSKEAKEYIIDLLNDGKWYSGIAKCDSDVNFYPNGFKLGYCAESGVFNDFTLKRSLSISDDARDIINEYLGLN
jgi:hypothetical protein